MISEQPMPDESPEFDPAEQEAMRAELRALERQIEEINNRLERRPGWRHLREADDGGVCQFDFETEEQ